MPIDTTAVPAARPPLFFWLALLAAVVTVCLFVFNGVIAYRYGLYDKFGYEVATQADGLYVRAVHPGSPAAGKLQAGDKLLAFDEVTSANALNWPELHKYLYASAPLGTLYTVRLERSGSAQTVILPLTLYRTPDASVRWRVILGAFLLGAMFAVVALLVALLKPQEPAARRVSVAMWLFAVNTPYSLVLGRAESLLNPTERWLLLASYLLSGATMFIAAGYHLYYRFPSSIPTGRFWSAVKWLLYGLGGLVYLLGAHWVALRLSPPHTEAATLQKLIYLRSSTVALNNVYILLGLTAICAVTVRNYRLATAPNQYHRIRLVIFGTLAAVLPNLLVYLVMVVLMPRDHFGWNYASPVNLVADLSYLALILLAVTWAYAIFKQQVLDVRVVIRRGVRYLLARNVLSALLALPLVVLIGRIALEAERPLKEILFAHPLNLALIALAAVSLLVRHRLRAWLDRRFFREAYRQERILRHLIEEIKNFTALPELAEAVRRQLRAALHPSSLYLYFRQPELALSGTSQLRPLYLNLPPDAELLRQLDGQTAARDFPAAGAKLPPNEQSLLEQLDVRLIVPMSGTNQRLTGLLLLGEKRSEQPYSREDRALLEAVAQQMAVVCENLRLKEQVSHELKIKHEVLAHLSTQHINLVRECPQCGLCYDSDQTHCRDDGRELTLTVPVERTIDGKYRLEQRVGAGGMGAVYATTDLRLKRRVALKLITGSLFGNRAAQQRFAREAQAAAKLSHPNVVAIYDYGQAGAEGAYLVMEFLTGHSLRRELNQRGAYEPAQTVELFAQILAGLQAAHNAGVVHRDLKPDNVLLVPQPNGHWLVKLLDFGLAKLRQAEAIDALPLTMLTAPGMLLGTPGYMAPEQLAGGEADERSDIFALGVMIVEILTGHRPFAGQTLNELQTALATQDYHLPGAAPEIVRLDVVIQKCLARDYRQRYADIATLQSELLPALRACPPLPLKPPPSSATTASASPLPAQATHHRADVKTELD